MDINSFLHEAFWGSIKSVWQMIIMIFPILLILRIARDYNWLNRVSNIFAPSAKILNLPKEAVFPLLVGITFGLQYGAGVLIQTAKEGILKKQDMLLVNIFLGICHAIFEDTFLFMAIGANGLVLVVSRFFLAFLVTLVVSITLVKFNISKKITKTANN